MTYYVTQYGDFFFVLRKVQGYVGNMIMPCTKITAKEYKLLYNSTSMRELIMDAKGPNSQAISIRIQGNANMLLGRNIVTLSGKE